MVLTDLVLALEALAGATPGQGRLKDGDAVCMLLQEAVQLRLAEDHRDFTQTGLGTIQVVFRV